MAQAVSFVFVLRNGGWLRRPFGWTMMSICRLCTLGPALVCMIGYVYFSNTTEGAVGSALGILRGNFFRSNQADCFRPLHAAKNI